MVLHETDHRPGGFLDVREFGLFGQGWLKVKEHGYRGRVQKSRKRDFHPRSSLREKREMKKAKKG